MSASPAPTGSVMSETVPLSVLMVAEGTYPYHFGGVSTWCQALAACMPETRFSVVAITDHPGWECRFDPPPNVVNVENRALWGLPYLDDRRSRRAGRSSSTTEAGDLQAQFLPAYREFLRNVLGPACDPTTTAHAIAAMHTHFLRHGFERTMRRNVVWQTGTELLTELLTALIEDHVPPGSATGVRPTVADVTTVTMWTRHWLSVLAKPLPATDVVHAAMAGLCTLVCVAAQQCHGARFLLTEHGVYLREVYFAEASEPGSILKLVRVTWAKRLTELSYAMAEQISPCCDFNQRWELRNGADPAKLRTIYYGVDPDRYQLEERPVGEPPVVVWAGRINPLKDLETLLRAAARVCQERPDATFRLFGTAGDEDKDYERRCLELWRELDLERRVAFRGFTDQPDREFRSGDMVVLPSISEGFPNVTLEAMLNGRPVIASAIGGLPEQIAGTGVAVRPRNPWDLAESILALINDGEAARRLGREARERAATRFTVDRLRDEYDTSYRRLVAGLGPEPALGTPAHELGSPLRSMRVLDPGAVGPVRAGARAVRTLVPWGAATPTMERSDGPVRLDRRRLSRVVNEVAAHGGEPVDALEVAALLESLGITDPVAREIGADDVFALSNVVLDRLRKRRNGQEWWAGTRPPVQEEEPSRDRGPTVLVLSGLVLALVPLLRRLGHWSGGETLGFAVGISAGIACANGLVLAAARALSFYLANDDRRLAREFLRRATPLAAAAASALGVVLVGVIVAVARPHLDVVAVAVCGFATIALAWTAIGLASVLMPSHRAAAPALLSAAAFIGIDRATRGPLPWHLTFAFLATVALLASAYLVVIDRALGKPTATASRLVIPRSTLTRGAAPYFWCGLLATVPLLAAHALVWAAPHPALERVWHHQLAAVEVGLTLSLAPAIISVSWASYAIRRFWQALTTIAATTPAGSTAKLTDELDARRRLGQRALLVRVAAGSVIAGIVALIAVHAGATDSVTGAQNHGLLLWTFGGGLIAYGMYAWGSLNIQHAVSLGAPSAGVVALLATAASIAAFGWPIATAWGAWSGAPLVILSCTTYGLASAVLTRRALTGATQLLSFIS